MPPHGSASSGLEQEKAMDELTDNVVPKIGRATEQHKYAVELIENLIDASVGADLNRGVLLEVMAVYAIGYNLDHGDPKMVRSLLNHALRHIEVGERSGHLIDSVDRQTLH